ncbi:ABC transporter permease, partial [Vibrio ostreicida]|nr:ABC transporter permease [Vibrio ostreicida]
MTLTLTLAWKSVRNRRATALLSILTVAISVVLLLGVERIRTQAKSSFANTISGT